MSGSLLERLPTKRREITAAQKREARQESDFRRRSKTIREMFASTVKQAVPNLGKKIFLIDADGIEWEMTQGQGDTMLAMKSTYQKDGETWTKTAVLTDTRFNSRALHMGLHEAKDVLNFYERKIPELLKPIQDALDIFVPL